LELPAYKKRRTQILSPEESEAIQMQSMKGRFAKEQQSEKKAEPQAQTEPAKANDAKHDDVDQSLASDVEGDADGEGESFVDTSSEYYHLTQKREQEYVRLRKSRAQEQAEIKALREYAKRKEEEDEVNLAIVLQMSIRQHEDDQLLALARATNEKFSLHAPANDAKGGDVKERTVPQKEKDAQQIEDDAIEETFALHMQQQQQAGSSKEKWDQQWGFADDDEDL